MYNKHHPIWVVPGDSTTEVVSNSMGHFPVSQSPSQWPLSPLQLKHFFECHDSPCLSSELSLFLILYSPLKLEFLKVPALQIFLFK